MNLREAKQELREHGYILEKKEQLDEGVLAIAGGVALGLLALKVVGKIFGAGLKGLISLLVEGNHRACLMIIEKNKAEIAAEIKDKLLANPEITDAIQNGELTKKLVKNSIEREFRGLLAKQYNSKGLQNAYNQWRERDFKSRGWHGGTNGLEGALDNSLKMSEITDALADVVYDAIKDIQIEQA